VQTEGHLQVEFVLEALRGLWHAGQQLQSTGQMIDSFHMGTAVEGILRRLVEIMHSTLSILAAHKVLRQFSSDLARVRLIGLF
jgi:hypothetical protein